MEGEDQRQNTNHQVSEPKGSEPGLVWLLGTKMFGREEKRKRKREKERENFLRKK